jgi:ankyrin repeat protein
MTETITKIIERNRLSLLKALDDNDQKECIRLIGLDLHNVSNKFGCNIINAYIMSRKKFNKSIFKILIDHNREYISKLKFYTHTNDLPPIYYSIVGNNYEACKMLIENGANINIKNKLNHSLLHSAVNYKASEICELLVENGADILAENDLGLRPSEYCCDILDQYSQSYRIYNYLKQKEKEQEELNQCFKRAHIEEDTEDPDIPKVEIETITEQKFIEIK